MLRKPTTFVTAILGLAAVVALTKKDDVSATMFSPNPQQDQQQERRLIKSIPSHVPLEIKIRKEKEKKFKDLNNENWARDFELEVTNTGTKPIYSFSFILLLDVKAAAGFQITAPLSYGRVELSDHRIRATPEDVPVNPGASVILKIYPSQVTAWEKARREEGRQHPKVVKVRFQNLSFGDGTGLMGPAATPVPRNNPQQSTLNRCETPRDKGGTKTLQGLILGWTSQSLRFGLPALYLPANFLCVRRPGTLLRHKVVARVLDAHR